MDISKEKMKFKTLLTMCIVDGYIDDSIDKLSDKIVETTDSIYALMEELKHKEINKSDSITLKGKLRHRSDLIDELAEELSNRDGENQKFIEYLRLEYKDKIYTEEFCIQLMDITGKIYINDALSNIPESKRTYKVCLHAVKNYEHQLKLTPIELRDENICIVAVGKDPLQLSIHVPIEKMTPYFWRKTALKYPTYIIPYLPRSLFDKVIATHAINNDLYLIEYIPEDIIDEDIMDIYNIKCEERDLEIKKFFDNLTNKI